MDKIFSLVILLITAGIFIVDLEHQLIPDSLTFYGYVLVLSYVLIFNHQDIYLHLLSGLFSGLFLLSLYFITKGKGMGLGDVKLVVFLGTFLAFPYNLAWMMLAFILGALFGLTMVVLGAAGMKSRVAFGPFIILSFWIILFFGESILRLYIR